MKFNRSVIFLLFCACVWAQTRAWAGPGRTSAQVLRVGISARASAMGDAFCAVSDDISALCWNPAGLSQAAQKTVSLSVIDLYQEFKIGQAGYLHPLKNDNVVAFSYCYLDSGEIPRTLATNRGLYESTSGSFRATSYVITLGASDIYAERLYIGTNIRNVGESIDEYKGQGFACDVGLMYKALRSKQLTFGGTLSNILGTVKLGVDSVDMPQATTLGVSYRIKGSIIDIDRKQTSDGGTSYHSGIEIALMKALFIRAGYTTLTTPGATMGFGLDVKGICFDYSVQQTEFLGYAHKVTTSFKFGEKLEKEDGIWRDKTPWYMQ